MSKYGILVKTVQGSGYFGQYQFHTFINDNNEKEIFLSDNLDEIDTKLEKMINGDYRKKDLLVADIYDFNAFVDLVENSQKQTDKPKDDKPSGQEEDKPTENGSENNGSEENNSGENSQGNNTTSEVAITSVSKTVTVSGSATGPDGEQGDGEVSSVTFTAEGTNLPADIEYTWVFTVGGNIITKNSTGTVLEVTDEDKEVLASPTSVVISVGEYTSEAITLSE